MDRDLYRCRCHIRTQAKPRCFPLNRRGSKAAPEESRARLLGAAKRTLDAEDRFERIEKGGDERDKSEGGIRFDHR
jgi:hypothetical protein